MIQLTIRFYSLFKNLAGVGQTTLLVGDQVTIEELLPVLAQKYPNLPLENEHICFLVNEKIAGRDHSLQAGDQISIFEMFAGG